MLDLCSGRVVLRARRYAPASSRQPGRPTLTRRGGVGHRSPTVSVRTDGPTASRGPDTPVVLFDGWCPLCVGTVRFVLKRDRARLFRFAPLDSAAARDLLDRCAVDPHTLDGVRSGTTVALICRGRLQTKSDAALGIAARLPLPWRTLSVLRLVPRSIRNRAYSAVARGRHRIWGRLDSCHVPDAGDLERFL